MRYEDYLNAFVLGGNSGGGESEPVLLYYNYDGSELLYTEVLTSGGSGTYTGEPERTSTAQYDYTFAGWTLEPNGEADTGAQSAVTKNRKVYAAYTAAVRSYTVRFFNGSTVLQTSTVPYGDAAVYSGQTPVKQGVSDPTLYEFNGWALTPNGQADPDALANITADRDVYAAYAVDAECEYTASGQTVLGSLADAVAGADSGTTVYLMADIILRSGLTVAQAALTIDTKDAGVVYIIGSNSDSVGLTVAKGANLVLQNVQCSVPITINGGLEIVSGMFEKSFTHNQGASLSISGGTFLEAVKWIMYYGYIKDGCGINVDAANYVWRVVEEAEANLSRKRSEYSIARVWQRINITDGNGNDDYVSTNIFYSELDAAITSATATTANNPVYLLKDIKLDAYVPVDNNAVIEGEGFTIMAGDNFNGDSIFRMKDGTADQHITLSLKNVTVNGNNQARSVDVGASGELTTDSVTTLEKGSADQGGAIYAAAGSSVTLNGTKVQDNAASAQGGAIYATGTGTTVTGNGATFSGNTAPEGPDVFTTDGAVYVDGASS